MQILLKKLWSNNFLKGGVFYTTASLLVSVMNYLFNLIAGRSLGPQGYGDLTALFSYLTIATIPMVVFSNFVIQKIVETTKSMSEAKYLESIFWEKLRKLFFPLILLIFLSPILAKLTNLSSFLSFALILFIILTIISSMYSSLLQGLQLFLAYSLIGVAATFIKLAGAITVLFGLDGIFSIITFIFVSIVLGIILGFIIFHNHIKVGLKKMPDLPKMEKRLIQLFKNRQFQLIFFSTFALTLFNNADIVFVKKYFTSFDAGIYSSWSLFSKIILYTLGPFIAMSFIFFSSQQSQKTEKKTLNLSLITLLAVGIVSFLVYKYFAAAIINIFFGQKFTLVEPFLAKASIFGTLYTGVTFISNFFLAKKSRLSLILFFSIVPYILLLFFIKRDLSSVMNLNITFSILLFVTYLLLYFKFFLFDSRR